MTHMKRFHETEGGGSDRSHCQFCPKTFLYKAELEAHENTHTGTKDYKCHCGKAYSSKKALYDHNKIVHSQAKETFSCEVCGKVLRDKYKLKYHMMVIPTLECIELLCGQFESLSFFATVFF